MEPSSDLNQSRRERGNLLSGRGQTLRRSKQVFAGLIDATDILTDFASHFALLLGRPGDLRGQADRRLYRCRNLVQGLTGLGRIGHAVDDP